MAGSVSSGTTSSRCAPPWWAPQAAVAVFLPIALRVCQEHRISPSRVLMPMSFFAMLGGTCTLIGTSTNILVSTMAEAHGHAPEPEEVQVAVTGLPRPTFSYAFQVVDLEQGNGDGVEADTVGKTGRRPPEHAEDLIGAGEAGKPRPFAKAHQHRFRLIVRSVPQRDVGDAPRRRPAGDRPVAAAPRRVLQVALPVPVPAQRRVRMAEGGAFRGEAVGLVRVAIAHDERGHAGRRRQAVGVTGGQFTIGENIGAGDVRHMDDEVRQQAAAETGMAAPFIDSMPMRA